MDYTSFYPSTAQQFANPLSASNPPFSLSQNGPTQVPANRSSRNIPQQNNPIAQLQQNMFYLDPFESKLGEASSNDMDHASYSNESDVFLDELDEISRAANAAQTRRTLSNGTSNGSHQRNPSPQGAAGLQNGIPRLSSDFDLGDMDFLESQSTSGGAGNSSKRKAQNRAAQRAFRERKERHVKELEAKVAQLEEMSMKMVEENQRLHSKMTNLESENNMLKGSNVTFTFPQFEKAAQNGDYSPPLSDHGSFDFNKQTAPSSSDQLQPVFDLDTFFNAECPPQQAKPISPVSLSDQSQKSSNIHSQHSHPHSESQSPQTPVSARAQNLMMQYHDYTQHSQTNRVQVTPMADDGHHYFDCPKVWERIVSHPRFDEVDVEALCAALNAKVRIVVERGGPSVDGSELEAALDQAMQEVAPSI